MNVRISVALTIASLLWLTSPVQAQSGTAYLTEDPGAIESSGSVYGVTPLGVQGSRIWASADVGQRPGNIGNYYSFGGFMPMQLWGPESSIITTAQGWIDENGNPGIDFTGGYRHMIDPLNSIVGINSFFTFDNSINQNGYRRYGFGAEWLTEFVTATGNLYLPIDRGANDFGSLVRTKDGYFSGQNLFFRNFQYAEQQLKGGDFEVGATIPQATWLSVYSGGYFYNGNGTEDVKGYQGRVQFDLSSVVANLSFTNDSQFGNTVYGSVQYVLGPGIPQFTPRTRDLYSRMYDNVGHRTRVFMQEFTKESAEVALRPDGDGTTPWTFIHINNTNAQAGDGTFENPFNTLDGANGVAGQIILVHRGTTSINNPLDGGTGLVLQNNQIVLGEGTPYQLTFSNRAGFCPLPGFDPTGANPFITADPGSDVITLANNNIIDGLNILSPGGGNAFAGNNVSNFTIQNINKDLAGANSGLGGGIVLQNATGFGVIQNVGFRSGSPTSDGGIVIDNTNVAALNLNVNGVPFLSGGSVGVRLSGNNSRIDATLEDIVSTGTGRGLDLVASNNGKVTASIVDSSFTNTTVDHGLSVRSSTTGQASLVATNVNVSGAALDGLFVDANGSTSTALVTDSDLSGAGRNSVNVQGTGASGVANVQIVRTDGSGAATNGVNVNLSNQATSTISLFNSQFDNAGTSGGFVATLDNSTATVTIDDTTLNDAGTVGFGVQASNGSNFSANLVDAVNMNNAGTDAIFASSNSGSIINITGAGSGIRGANAGLDAIALFSTGAGSHTLLNLTDPGTFANAGQAGALMGSGLFIQSDNGGNVEATIFGNPTADAIFANASRDGVTANLGATAASAAKVNLNYVDLSGAGRDAFNANVANSSLLTITNLRNSDLQNANRDGLHLTTSSNGQITGSLENVQLDSAGNSAIHMSSLGGGDIAINGSGVSGTGAGGDAIFLEAIGAGSTTQLGLTATGSFLNPVGNGIAFNGNNSGAITFNINGGNFGQGANGLIGVLDNGATASFNLDGVNFDNADQNGMHITANNGAFFQGTVQTSSFANAGANALEFDFANGLGAASLSMLTFLDTAMNNATVDAINISALNNSQFGLHIINTSVALPGLSNYGDNMLDQTISGGSIVQVLIDPTNATTNKATSTNGIQVNATGAGTRSIVTLLDSPLSNLANPIGQNAVFGNIADGARFDLTLDNSEISNAGASGVDVTLTNGSIFNANLLSTSIDGAAQDGFRVNATNSTVNLIGGNSTRTGVPQTGLSVDGTGQNAFNITLNNSIGTFNLDNFSADGNGQNGFLLNANGAGTQVGLSTIQNGTFNDNGAAGVDNSSGISITATNGAQIGSRALVQGGIQFNNITSGNTVDNARTQDNGLRFRADSDGYIGLAFNNANFTQNESHGIDGIVNEDQSLNDTALAIIALTGSFVDNNHGDGAFLRAFNGNDVFGNPQTSGIIFSAMNSQFNQNGDGPATGGFLGNPPQTGANGNSVGFGINALADGDNTVAGNTQITLNLQNTDILNNEEGSINPVQTDGGVVNLNIMGGMIDITGLNQICAMGPLDIRSISLDGVTLVPNAAGPGFSLQALNGGRVMASLSNLTIANNAGTGIVMDAQTDGDINLTLNNVTVQNNGTLADPKTGLAAIAAIQSITDGAGSTTSVNMTNVNILDHAGYNAFEAIMTNGGAFSANMTNVTSTNNTELATEGALEINAVDANTAANLTINGFSDDGSLGSGVNIIGNGSVNIAQLDNINIASAADRGVNVQVNQIGNLNANNVNVTNATNAGVNIQANGILGGTSNVTLNNVTATANGGGLNVDIAGMLATDVINLNITNSDFSNAATGNGVNLQFNGLDGTVANITANGLAANNAAANGIQILQMGGVDLNIPTFNNISATNATGTGLLVSGTAFPGQNLTQFNMTTGNFDGAGADGVLIQTFNDTQQTNISLTDVTANGATGTGINIFANALTGAAGTSSVTLTNVDSVGSANGAQITTNVDGGSTASVSVTGGSDFSNSTGTGLSITQMGANSIGSVLVQNVTADGSGAGIAINQNGLTAGANSITLDSVSAQSTTSGDGLNVQATGLTTNSVAISMTGTNNFANSAQDGIDIGVSGPNTASASISISGASTNVDGAANTGLRISPTGGILTAINALNNISAQNAGNIGVDITANNGSVTVLNANGMNVSGAQNRGLNIVLTNQTPTVAMNLQNITANSTVNGDNVHIELDNVGAGLGNSLALNGLQANLAGDDGIDLALRNNTVLNITQFNNVTAQQNQENGFKINVASGSSIPNFVASGIDLSNNGTSGVGFDGLDVQVHGAGSQATFNLANLTINNSGGRGIDLDVFNGGSLTFNVNGGTVNNSGLQGVDINVGTQDEFGSPLGPAGSANFSGTFSNLNVTNSGTSGVFTADGINVDVNGNGVAGGFGAGGVTASLTFTGGSSTANDGDGYDLSADNGAVMNVSGSGINSSNNVGRGLFFSGDGASTVVSLNLTGANTFNNNVGASGAAVAGDGPGAAVLLTNGVTATNITIAGTATGNDGDGVRVRANDGTGVTINNLDTSGVISNNNLGSGLVIDLNMVAGVNNFSMNNASFSGNLGDQVFVQFREMNLTNLSFTNTTFTGTAGSGDGLDLRLIDSSVTGQLTFDNITARNNGGNGLNLLVDEQVAGGNVAQINSGVVTHSEFSNNTLSGANMVFGGAGVNNMFIFENSTTFGPNDGFRNNGQSGLAMRIEDTATMNISGANPINGAGAFYDNQFNGNGNIGFNFIANEPADVNVVDLDGMGPTYNLMIGDILRDPNEFTNNGEAGMALQGRNDSRGTVTFVNSIFSGNTNVAGGPFNGDGLAIRLENNAILTDLQIDGTNAGLDMNNNAGSGLLVSINQNSRLGTNTNMTVLNTTISGNGRHGLEIERRDDALFGLNAATNRIVIGQAGALAAGTENMFVGNALSGVNILNQNMPGTPVPLQVQMTENIFAANRDGTFMHGTGNAQFTGALTDNIYTANSRDGARFLLENDAALGDPNDLTGTPFLLAGNQVTMNGRHGIFFDTNATNESGTFSGGAYVNTLISGGTVNARTLIAGNGQNGIQIIDNSDFFNGAPAGMQISQNTYRIIQSDIVMNSQDGINAIQAQAGTAINNNSGIALIIGDAAAPDRRDVRLSGNGDDGLDLLLRDDDGMANTLTITNTEIMGNGFAGDGENATIAGRGHGIEIDQDNAGRLVATFTNVDIVQNGGDGIDWSVTTNQEVSGGTIGILSPTVVNMTGTNISQNAERGLDVRLTHDVFTGSVGNQSGAQAGTTSVWNLGAIGGPANRFNENGREGIVFDLQATGIDSDVVNINGTTGVITDTNNDIFIDTNIGFQPNYPRGFPAGGSVISTSHGPIGGGTTFSGNVVQETRRRVQATVNLLDSQVANNGGLNGFEDGFAAGIGYLTRLNLTIAGVGFGGNVGDDIRLYGQRSGEFDLPIGSVNNNPAATVNGLPQNFAIYDPVAYLDFQFGSVNGVSRGNGRAVNFVDFDLDGFNDVGDGNQITIINVGTGQTAPITATGIITGSNDAFRSATRSVALAGQVQFTPNFGNTSVNDFFQNGVQQNIFNQFTGFIINGVTPFPDGTFPP